MTFIRLGKKEINEDANGLLRPLSLKALFLDDFLDKQLQVVVVFIIIT